MKRLLKNYSVFNRGEKVGDFLIRPFQTFAQMETSGGILLVIVTAVALFLANSSYQDFYHRIWHISLKIGVGSLMFDQPLHFWINDGLMTIFFFVVGLEIKREVLAGELASFDRAALPVAAAIGGMLVPAGIYSAFNYGSPGAGGWGIPMATDIAFTLGVVTVLGSRIPKALAIFITALAIVDDLGAVIVIAVFYTEHIVTGYLWITGSLFIILIILNIMGFHKPLVYIVFGLSIWFAVYMSGIHSTIAGILVAMVVPARSGFDTDVFLGKVRRVLGRFRCRDDCGYSIYKDPEHRYAVHTLSMLCQNVETPLQRIEHALHPWVVFLIVPVFAFANAGVTVNAEVIHQVVADPISPGIILGLFLGKQLGIFSASWIAIRMRMASLPSGVGLGEIYGASILCGIGFTMSFFVANLAFRGSELMETAKLSILIGSFLSLVAGFIVLYAVSSRTAGHSDQAESSESAY